MSELLRPDKHGEALKIAQEIVDWIDKKTPLRNGEWIDAEHITLARALLATVSATPAPMTHTEMLKECVLWPAARCVRNTGEVRMTTEAEDRVHRENCLRMNEFAEEARREDREKEKRELLRKIAASNCASPDGGNHV